MRLVRFDVVDIKGEVVDAENHRKIIHVTPSIPSRLKSGVLLKTRVGRVLRRRADSSREIGARDLLLLIFYRSVLFFREGLAICFS